MKKYVVLVLTTLILLCAIGMSGYALRTEPAEVSTAKVCLQEVENTITAGGRLQYRSGREVRSLSAGIVRSVSVKNGDDVKKGDLLLEMYHIEDKYISMLSQLTGLEDGNAVASAVSGFGSYDSILERVKEYCTIEKIFSPSDGRVSSLDLAPDSIVTKNKVLLRLTSQQKLEIPINISETEIERVKTGQKAEVTFSALPGEKYRGSVTKVAKEASQTSGLTGKETTVEVTVTLDKNDSRLRPGYTASCCVVTSRDKDVIMLPYDEIRTDEEGDHVMKVVNGRARRQSIITGTEYKEGAAVTEGLCAGDVIILSGQQVTEGQKVIIKDGGE